VVSDTVDDFVVDPGAMGSATPYQLAKRGRRVLGLEMFRPGHDRGSSHGHHRMIRKSSFGEDGYVPPAARDFELWRELEIESGRNRPRPPARSGSSILAPAPTCDPASRR
jgi:sarcosine oxidase